MLKIRKKVETLLKKETLLASPPGQRPERTVRAGAKSGIEYEGSKDTMY